MTNIVNMSDWKRHRQRVQEEIENNEYGQFIELLKYFVGLNESKCDLIEVHIETNKPHICKDSEDNVVPYEHISSAKYVERLEEEMSYDELLISRLIVLSPKTIVIKNLKAISSSLRRDLTEIFEDRIKL